MLLRRPANATTFGANRPAAADPVADHFADPVADHRTHWGTIAISDTAADSVTSYE